MNIDKSPFKPLYASKAKHMDEFEDNDSPCCNTVHKKFEAKMSYAAMPKSEHIRITDVSELSGDCAEIGAHSTCFEYVFST